MTKVLGIIPARYASTRFPGKPLADINGKSMIRRVWEQAMKAPSLSSVLIATDDERIAGHVKEFGGEVVLTSPEHQSGTERCAEAVKINPDADIIINIQGDEPFIDPSQIDQLSSCFEDPEIEIATLIKKTTDLSYASDHNTVKVVTDNKGKALYFSRAPIPYGAKDHLYKHIGIYAYRQQVLKKIVTLKPGKLEKAESLEQLRWLENGYNIYTLETDYESFSVDTPADLQKLV